MIASRSRPARPALALALTQLAACGAAGTDAPRFYDTPPGATVGLTGQIRQVIADPEVPGPPAAELVLFADSGEMIPLQLPAHLVPDPDTRVAVTGVRGARALEAGDVRGMPTSGPGPGALRGALRVSGPRKVAVVLLKMSDSTATTKPDDVRTAIFTRHSAFLREVSLDHVTLVGKNNQAGDVYGPYAIASASTPCEYSKWTTEGRAAAQAAGVDLGGYDHILYHADKASCSWAGIASMPGSWLMVKAGYISNDAVTGHEFGHNLGLHHGNTYSCKDAMGARVSLSDTCTTTEYGDPFDLMGGVVRRHLNASSKAFLGWLPSYAVTVSGRYFLTFQEQRYSMPQVLSIVRARLPSGAPQDFFSLEVRQPFGIDNFAAGSPVLGGVSLRLINVNTRAQPQTQLLDATPQTTSFTDAPLAVGKTFADAKSGVRITTVSLDQVGAVVDIQLP